MIVNLKQGTQEWLDFRNTRVTATDFCAIAAENKLCQNLYKKSSNQLIKDKLNPKIIKTNPFFELGHAVESGILKEAGYTQNPIIHTYDLNSNIMASLDHQDDKEDLVIDVKAKTVSLDKIEQSINYYKYQIIHQMYCAKKTHGRALVGVFDKKCVFEKYDPINEKSNVLISDMIMLLKFDIVNDLEETVWYDLNVEFLKRLKNAIN